MLKVLSVLGDPHLTLKNNIIISGTNGKGTVATILNKIYSDSGYKVGLYTSPHLIQITERIRISSKKIKQRRVVDAGFRPVQNPEISHIKLIRKKTY